MRKSLLTFLGIGLLGLVSCSKVIHLADTRVQVYTIESPSQLASDTLITSLITPYKSALDAEMNASIGTCAKRLEKQQPESTLGNWMADAFLFQARQYFDIPIDFAVQNYGGIRIPYLAEGVVTKGNIYELMPFENRMVILKMKGAVLQTFFDHIAQLGGWPVSKSVQFDIQNNQARHIHINGVALNKERVYTMALPDYIANGGDNCSFLENYEHRIDSEHLIREALLAFIAQQSTIDGDIEGRIRLLE